VSKRDRRGQSRAQTMAEMLQAFPATTPTARQDAALWDAYVDTGEGVGLPAPNGQVFDRLQADVSAGQAQSLVEAGALVAWDGCGCSSSACLIWLDADRRQALAGAGRPHVQRRAKRRFGSLSHWQSRNGLDLIVAECDVRWGDVLA
jgi:hypothetical protein